MKTRPFLLPIIVAALYLAWPYATLMNLQADLRHHDVRALQSDIDWASVRDGMKQDIFDGLEGRPAPTNIAAVSGDDDLPPFGAGFAAHIAGHAVDQAVTPQRLADAFGTFAPGGGPALQPRLEAAHFDGLADFVVKLRTVQQAPTDPPVCLHLSLAHTNGHFGWQVTRVSIPASLLQQSETHAS